MASEKQYVEIVVKGNAEIARMQPGDILLVKYDGALSTDLKNRIEAMLKESLPDGVKTVVAGRDITFSILRPVPESSPCA